MAEHNEMGKEGEELAAEYLVKQGYTIEARNWRYGHEEIDIIARKDDLLLIVEVKTRRSNYFGQPESFVSFAKQKALIRCANRYIYQHNFEGDTRFDIISIIMTPKGNQINHIPNAFYPTLR
ncbi:MAG: YraN family protein [Bacteroidales bacterium]|nr:YraN family protein [Bacteroidales bacterium]MBP9511827.1 YraN family protein [Bacteroidales bacterium]HNV17326.1 YraN family protein [Bacteroidales bacterium]HOC15790.1 YraN family protein [Bacteroidales bacterium]HRS33935.1 YraN family protein [Bacteroidales bacterium]